MGKEVFDNFYTNKKARPLSKRMANADTLEGADADNGNALSVAKVQRKFETTKENGERSI